VVSRVAVLLAARIARPVDKLANSTFGGTKAKPKKRAHLIDLKREHLIDQVCSLPPDAEVLTAPRKKTRAPNTALAIIASHKARGVVSWCTREKNSVSAGTSVQIIRANQPSDEGNQTRTARVHSGRLDAQASAIAIRTSERVPIAVKRLDI
jgi:hypothetical protein